MSWTKESPDDWVAFDLETWVGMTLDDATVYYSVVADISIANGVGEPFSANGFGECFVANGVGETEQC